MAFFLENKSLFIWVQDFCCSKAPYNHAVLFVSSSNSLSKEKVLRKLEKKKAFRVFSCALLISTKAVLEYH